jgi:hypothetical protein
MPRPSELMQKMLDGELPTVTLAQLQGYLAANRRNAESLIAASRLTSDLSLLREAAQKFPNDPRVQFELAMRSEDAAERARAAQAFAGSDRDNALASYLAASQAFAAGDVDDAIMKLTEASQRTAFRDYVMANAQASEDALVAAGVPGPAAKMAALFGAPMPFMTELNGLSRQMAELAKSYASSGDADSAAIISHIGQTMGEQLQHASNGTLLGELVGIAVESRFLKDFDPSAILTDGGLTVQQRVDQLAERKKLIQALSRTVDPTTMFSDPQVLGQFIDRQKLLGEAAALQWLKERIGEKQPP